VNPAFHEEGCRTRTARSVSLLPDDQRAVVLRCFYWGWTTGCAARDLGITDATVKSRLHDALRLLLAWGD
jgi:RNA polymerase sigma-70 factor, ECF subfamily